MPAPGTVTAISAGPTAVGAAIVVDSMEVAARKRRERRANMLIDEDGGVGKESGRLKESE